MSTTLRNVIVRVRPDAVVVAISRLGREEAPSRLDSETVARLVRDARRAFDHAVGTRHMEIDTAFESDVSIDEGAAIEASSAEVIGGVLYRALFDGERGALLARGRGPREDGVRIIIEVDPRAAERGCLALLPWELIFSPREQQFLALNRTTPVVRSIPVSVRQLPPPRAGRLRILAIAAEPVDLSGLDLESEIAALQALDRQTGIRVHLLSGTNATVDGIRQAFERVRPHVMHFMGHGSFDRANARGRLHVVSEAGLRLDLDGSELASMLRDVATVRLVVLNACDTGRSSDRPDASMRGVAQAVLLAGVPAVIAMQQPIRDVAAVVLGRELYRRIASGTPVDQALAGTRRAMRSTTGDLEWAKPVLYASDPNQLQVFRTSVATHLKRAALVCLPMVAILLVLSRLPISTAPVELDVTASRVVFRTSEAQRITAPFAVERVVARDLVRIRLPDGTLIEDPDGLDIDLRIGDGVDASGVESASGMTVLPIQATEAVQLTLTRVRDHRYRLQVKGRTQAVVLAVSGPWRFRRRGGPWKEGETLHPESVRLESIDHVSIDLEVTPGPDRDLDEAVLVTALALHELREVDRGGRTDPEKQSTLLSGTLRIGHHGTHRTLDPDEILGITTERLRLRRFQLSDTNGIVLRAVGDVSHIGSTVLDGESRSLMPNILTTMTAPAASTVGLGVVALVAVLALVWRFASTDIRRLCAALPLRSTRRTS